MTRKLKIPVLLALLLLLGLPWTAAALEEDFLERGVRLLLGVAPVDARHLGVALEVALQQFFVALFGAHGLSSSAERNFESA